MMSGVGFVAIERIRRYRVADAGQMGPDLVRTSGPRCHFHQAVSVISLEDAGFGEGGFAPPFIHNGAMAAISIGS
jgi:hypothetical protein